MSRKLKVDIHFVSKKNPLGLELGEHVTVRRTCTIAYDEKDNRRLFFEIFQRSGVVIGCVKRALGKYFKGSMNIFGEDYDSPYLAVDKYVWLYEVKNHINSKPFLVHPDDIVI